MTQDDLFEQLKHPNPHLQQRAMLALAEAYDEATIARLMSNLAEADVVYRRASVKALGFIGFDAVPALVESMLNSDNVTVRGSATKALAQIAVNHHDRPFPEQGMSGLKTALNDANPVVYIAAAMALGEVKSAAAVTILLEALKATDNTALAVTITNTLGSMGDERAIAALTSLSQDESTDSYVRETATSALSRLEMVQNSQRE